jgi:hypothetical protein
MLNTDIFQVVLIQEDGHLPTVEDLLLLLVEYQMSVVSILTNSTGEAMSLLIVILSHRQFNIGKQYDVACAVCPTPSDIGTSSSLTIAT